MLKKWDFFICHASEDKAEVVEPLAVELATRGAAVWYDRWTLQIGDSLSGKIDEGLASSEYGIVVLSPHFFTKPWPQRELGGLVQKEVGGRKVILPVWHKIDHAFVARHSPTLADKMAGSTELGIPILSEQLLLATGTHPGQAAQPHPPAEARPGPATLDIGYRKLKITKDLHRYSLTAVITLLSPPDQGRLRIRLLWPIDVRIARIGNIREGSAKRVDGVNYKELTLDWEQRMFPGETVQVLGPGAPHEIEYEYDHDIFQSRHDRKRDLHYTLFFEDHTPITGSKPFGELNVF